MGCKAVDDRREDLQRCWLKERDRRWWREGVYLDAVEVRGVNADIDCGGLQS